MSYSLGIDTCREYRARKKAGEAKAAAADDASSQQAHHDMAVETMRRLLDFFHVEDCYDPPTESRTLEDDIQLASDMRQYMDARNKTTTCAVCSCLCEAGYPESSDEDEEETDEEEEETDTRPRFTVKVPLHAIENIHLLRVDGPKTAELPRESLTRFGDYCLQEKGKDGVNAEGEDLFNVCTVCMYDLERGRVPRASLVRLDTGSIPEGLEPLSIIEEQLLGLGRACRYIFVMRPRGWEADLQQWCFRGHVIAFPNVSAKDISNCFPMPFADIPKNMQVGMIGKEALVRRSYAYELLAGLDMLCKFAGHLCHSS